MTKEAVTRHFFLDFLENLGDYEYDPDKGFAGEEGNMIIADFFFAGMMKLRWDPKKHMLRLEILESKSQ